MTWLGYIFRRLAWSGAVLIGVVLVTYGLGRLSDQDPVLTYLAQNGQADDFSFDADSRAYSAAAATLGFDLPPFFFGLSPKHFPDSIHQILPLTRRRAVHEQLNTQPSSILPKVTWYGSPNGFTHFLKGLSNGNMGYSLQSGQAVGSSLWRSFMITLPIALLALLLAVAFGIGLGLSIARRKRQVVQAVCYVLLSVPGFVLATIGVTQFAGRGKLFPGPGWIDATSSFGTWLSHAALPILTLSIPAAAYIALLLAESLQRADRIPLRDFARLQGKSERFIWWQDMLPLGIVPTVSTVVGLLIPSFLGGSVIVEYVFNIPGLGRTVIASILSRDWPMVLGVVLISGTATIIGYTIIDVVNAWIDPRWRKILAHV